MNAERLLQHYERIADAPDAIARLRRFVLDLAVRGKLVPQDTNDEPASELLKRLKHERTRHEKLKAIKRVKLQYGPIALDTDFDLPPKWVKTTLGETCDLQTGATPDRSRPEFFGGDIPWLVSGDINRGEIFDCEGRITKAGLDSSNCKVLPQNCVLIALNGQGKTRATVALLRTQATCNQSLVAIIPLLGSDLTAEYVHLSLKARYVAIRELTGKDERRGLNMRLLECFEIAIPPIAEQHRIVAKVDTLMVLCGRLEAARQTREAVRDRLMMASLARLNAPDTTASPAKVGTGFASGDASEKESTFQNDARFALDALPALTARPDQIRQLRQTILNLAVRGKLVPQNANDEPASELLKRIAKEKARLVKAGEIAREKPLPLLTEVDTVFELPGGWEWVRLGYLSKMVTSGSRDWAKHYASEGAIFVRMGNLSKDHYRLRLDHIQHVKPPTDGEGTRTRLAAGDILISITGEVGMLGLIPEGFGEAYINQHMAMVRPIDEIKGRYLPELFRSPFAHAQFNEPQRGIKNSFRLTDVTQFVVPLPPLAEQHRIVAMVDALMALCDRLEASLGAAATTRSRLLDALLAEALAPADDREMEAAE